MTTKHPREIEAKRQEEIRQAQEEIAQQLQEYKGTTQIIKKEETEIQRLLHDPELLDIIVTEIQNKKVVGEKETIETIFIITNCRKVINIKKTSSNLLVNDLSGLGKDWITKATLDILPKEDVVTRTKITPELFTYWHNPKFEPDWTWEGKIFYLEDAPNKIVNSDVFKVFSSGGSKATVLLKQTPVDIEIVGKPAMVVTSAEANPTSENLRRYPICFLDGSDDQTLSIMIRQSEENITGIKNEYNPLIQEALKKLERVKVVIPFADKLPYFFPKNRYMRTHYPRFLDYIKSVTCIFQYQRERNENGYVIATGNDYDIARRILLKTASNPSMIPLTRLKKDILDFFELHAGNKYAITDIEDKFPISDRWLRSQIKELCKDGFLLADKEFRDNVKKPVPIYWYNKINKIEIPTWENIINNEIFDSSVNTVNSFNSFNSVNSVNNSNGSNINGSEEKIQLPTDKNEKKAKKKTKKSVKKSTGGQQKKEQRNKRNKRNSELIQKNEENAFIPKNEKTSHLEKTFQKKYGKSGASN